MNFLPTIDINARGVQTALHTGQLRLQCGQWVTCGVQHNGEPGRPARFVRANRNHIWVIHWSPRQKENFKDICNCISK